MTARALFRLQLGGMAVGDFDELATTERFYAGGDRSVRGYKYQTLGPSDESGNNTGGRYLLTGSVESYGVGIFEPVSTLRLLYTLSSKWKLIGESSALRSSADLFYVIELGK